MFQSEFKRLGSVHLPTYSGQRIMMMPLVIGDFTSVPQALISYYATLERLFAFAGHEHEVGYLTIDEHEVAPGETLRRPGVHVDGIYHGGAGGWGGGGSSHASNGMITVSNPAGCRAWRQEFVGYPGDEGECNHLADQLGEATVFEPNVAYWCNSLCVHESMPMIARTERTFVRLSLPSAAPWFEGYTVNPLGIMPTGDILARREFM